MDLNVHQMLSFNGILVRLRVNAYFMILDILISSCINNYKCLFYQLKLFVYITVVIGFLFKISGILKWTSISTYWFLARVSIYVPAIVKAGVHCWMSNKFKYKNSQQKWNVIRYLLVALIRTLLNVHHMSNVVLRIFIPR